MVSLKYERKYWEHGLNYIAGVDEAGRGPIAGPVIAASVIFPSDVKIEGINDSKLLQERERERLFDVIHQRAISVGIGIIDHEVIDRINILNATFRSMNIAISNLKFSPDYLLIDGPHFPGANIPYDTIIKGDTKCFSIAAASIIAKVTRDRLMKEYDKLFPQYGFGQHKGYCTKAHLEAIKKFGVCEIHRKSFRIPVKIFKDDSSIY